MEILKKKNPWNKGKKGVQVAWNKGLKGVNKPSKTSFKKGEEPINKGIYTSKNTPAIHYWIKKVLGKPKKCDHCLRTDDCWYEWSNKNHLYEKNIDDWQRLCRGCHQKFDARHNNRYVTSRQAE